MIMFEIETKKLKISDELNRKIDMIYIFACVKYEFIPGNIKLIKNFNISLKDIKQDLKDTYHKMFNKNQKHKDDDFEL
jgi:phosphopantetheine adenylyltransferase